MIVLAPVLAVAVLLAMTERRATHFVFALGGYAALVACVGLVVGDALRAFVLPGLALGGIALVSRIKHHHSGLGLTLGDFSLLFAGTLRFLFQQYFRVLMGAIGGIVVLIGLGAVVLAQMQGEPASRVWWGVGLLASSMVTAVAYRLSGGRAGFRSTPGVWRGPISTFLASLIDPSAWRGILGRSRGLEMIDVATSALPLLPPVAGRGDALPDIIVIQHESLFDPRLYGLSVSAEIAAFLTPKDGLSGRLNVDIFGGGSWQSEFSVMTGLSSASFGSDAYFLMDRGVGRFGHTLPRVLAGLGYGPTLVSSCRRSFLNYDAFYRSIGFDERVFSDDLPAPFDVAEFERTYSDTMFLPAAIEVLGKRMARDGGPQFVYVLTNFNHGPHWLRAAEDGAARQFSQDVVADEQYGEFYARLSQTADAWARQRDALVAACPERRIIVLHYGDHQPVMTRRIENFDGGSDEAGRHLKTFYAVEALNFVPDWSAVKAPPVLDIAFLGTLAMAASGLPLDAVSATRDSLMAECGSAYFATDSERKRRFHRTLIEHGLINLGRRN